MATRPYLVDASPYLFRAYFSPGPDRPHKAVFGFVEFLIRLIREQQPKGLAVAFDASLVTSFRNDRYPAYKAQRELPPPELEAQLRDCKDAAEALGAAVFCTDRYEADDLLATLCARLSSAVIVSSDKDLAQLVTEGITLFDFARDLWYGPAEVEAKFGVEPSRITDLLALAGDKVDNIPGVKGIGPKSAVALISALGGVEQIYQRLEEVETLAVRGAKSLRPKLERHRDDALLSKWLATLATDAPLPETPDLTYRGADREKVGALFGRLSISDRIRDRIGSWR